MMSCHWPVFLFRSLFFGAFCFLATGLPANPRVLAPGPPPLTNDMVKKVSGFFEWVLEVQFTPAQAHEYESMLVSNWSDATQRQSTLQLLQTVDKAAAALPAVRDRAQIQVRRSLLASMRATPNDPEARWMLAVYEAAHPASPVEAERTTLPPGDPSPNQARLVGKWRSVTAAATQYKNSATGSWAPTSGHSFFYQFFPDGTYQSHTLLQVTTYGCTSSVYRDNSGTYRVEGDRFSIQPTRGVLKSQTCGGPPKEKEDVAPSTWVFHFESNANGEVLVISGVEEKTRPDYFNREK